MKALFDNNRWTVFHHYLLIWSVYIEGGVLGLTDDEDNIRREGQCKAAQDRTYRWLANIFIALVSFVISLLSVPFTNPPHPRSRYVCAQDIHPQGEQRNWVDICCVRIDEFLSWAELNIVNW